MKPDTIEASHGRWREILAAIGLDPKFLAKKQGPCPLCGGEDRYSFSDRSGDGDYICRHCGAGKGLKLVQAFKGWDFKTAAHEVDQIIGNLPKNAPRTRPQIAKPLSSAELNRIWREARVIGIDGADPITKYFHRRAIHILGASYAGVLRFAPAHWHPFTRSKHPAMIAKFCDADGHPKHLHQTYLTEDGDKAVLERVRLYTPGELPKGGAIRLGPEAETMGVAEGIETALSASALYSLPVWATTSTAMMMNWQPPTIVKRLAIFADADASFAGQKAAFTLAERLHSEAARDKIERDIDVLIPNVRDTDWNDIVMQMSEGRVLAAKFSPLGQMLPNVTAHGHA